MTQRKAEETRVINLEESYWAAEQRHDSAAVDNLLAPDYVSMSSRARGDRSKAEEIALLFGGRVHLESYHFSNMRAAWAAPDVVVLHYLVDQRFTLDGKTLCPHSGSMTLWAHRSERWLRVARTEYAIGNVEATGCQ